MAHLKLKSNELLFKHNGTKHFSISDVDDVDSGDLGSINSITAIVQSTIINLFRRIIIKPHMFDTSNAFVYLMLFAETLLRARIVVIKVSTINLNS